MECLRRWIACLFIMVLLMTGLSGPAVAEQTVVVYYSHSGKTKMACELIAKELNAHLIEVKDLKNSTDLISRFMDSGQPAVHGQNPDKRSHDRPKLVMDTEISPSAIDFSDYSRIVMASPIWMGALSPAIQKLLNTHRLDHKKVVLLTTSNEIIQFPLQEGFKDMVRKSGAEAVAYYQIRVVNDQKAALSSEEFLYEARKLLPAIRAVF